MPGALGILCLADLMVVQRTVELRPKGFLAQKHSLQETEAVGRGSPHNRFAGGHIRSKK